MERRPTAEEVISKLKDDGDFDTLRIKIIRKIKENDDFRNSIIAEVKQSATLNRDGAENLKPRQLSDAIHQEMGNKLMGQVSDEVWKIIRSSNGGMKNEIRETVESVYNKIVNPKIPEANHFSAPRDQHTSVKEPDGSSTSSTCEITTACEIEPSEPPGFALCDQLQVINSGKEDEKEPPGFALCDQLQVINSGKEDQKELLHNELPCEESKPELHGPTDLLPPSNNDLPGYSASVVNADLLGEGSDDDPDVPPGFG